MPNLFKKTPTYIIIAVIVIGGLSFWAYKVGVFGNFAVKQAAISYKGQSGKNALELLQQNYRVDTRVTGSAETVVGINGAEADSQHYWQLYINGAQAVVDPAQYQTKDGDTLEWKLQNVNTKL